MSAFLLDLGTCTKDYSLTRKAKSGLLLRVGNPEFLKEILMLSRYTHENLISLLGFCDEDGEKILVYEHAYHESLDRHLSAPNLTWWKSLKICVTANYLHDPKGTEQRVIRWDIKVSIFQGCLAFDRN
uniref:Serine-threonine/tyrosine-protein kinase catalytic domain-containing protein n=1 Tax=Lactuca sativa TaxID=4236 RepID=A0A9R1UJ61_LACSA|nr:hypothetical protein LSAT_V11C900504700 [Lactuca sativa]